MSFLGDINYTWSHILLAWRTSFSISCKAGLLAKNSLSFCLSRNVYFTFFVTFFERHFSWLWVYCLTLYFSTLNISSYCLLASIVSDEKSSAKLTIFSLVTFKISFLFQHFDYDFCSSLFFLLLALGLFCSFSGFLD